MAEINETTQEGINLPSGPEAPINNQMPTSQSPVSTGMEDNVPAVSDINFEDVVDVYTQPNTPGDLSALMRPDPIFESMLKQASIPINSVAPITGLNNIRMPQPGLATQTYNPYEQNTPADLTTKDGKAKFLQQGFYDAMTTPNKNASAPGYRPDMEWGIRESNFDRYYASNLYDQLGFHPYRNNEEIYNSKATFWDENQRARKQAWNTFQTGFLSTYDAIGDWMDGNYTGADTDGGQAFVDAMRIGNSSKKGLGGFTNRFLLNSGYTFGIVANIAAEEIILAGVTAFSGGGAAPAAAARTAMNVGRLGKAFRGFGGRYRDALKQSFFNVPGGSRIRAGAQLMQDLKQIENARQFFSVTGRGALNFLAPNTMHALRTLNTTKGTLRGLHNVKSINNTFGGFYRDFREINLAIAESKLEGGIVYNEMIDKLYHDYIRVNGEKPPMEKLDDIQQKALAASSATVTANAPLIYMSNRIVLGTILRGMPNGLGRLLARHQRGMGKRIFANSKLGPAQSRAAKEAGDIGGRIGYDGGATFLQRLKNRGVKGGLGAAGAFALRYTGANFAEGFQEISQEIIAKTAEDYYTGLFLDPSQVTSTLFDASLSEAIKAQISPQGFEVFMSGFLMGGLVQPVQRTFTEYLPRLYQWTKGNYGSQEAQAKYQEYKKNKEAYLEKAIDAFNNLAEDPMRLFGKTRLNATEQKQLNQRLLESSYASDMLSFMDDKDQAYFSQLHYLFETGTHTEFKGLLTDWLKMSDQELRAAFPEFKNEVKNGKLRERIEKFNNKIDIYENAYNVVKDKYPNPFDASQYTQGSKEYNEEALRQLAWDHSTKLMMYTEETFKRALERNNSIFQRLSNDSAISNMNSSDISVLLDLKALKTEIEMLESEIAVEATTAEQNELIETKKEKLKLLKNYLDVITNPENFIPTNKDGTDIILGAEVDYEEVGTDVQEDNVIEIGGKRFQAKVSPNKRVGTFDRRKIGKLKPSFMAYLNFLAEQKGEFITSESLEEVLKDIVDYKFLQGRSQQYFRAIENITNPGAMNLVAERIAERLKALYDTNQARVEKLVKKHVSDLEKNELINQLAGQGVYPDAEQVVLFFKEGIIPTIFHSEAGQVTPTDNREKWDTIQNLIKTWQKTDASESTVEAGDALNEDEITQNDQFDELARSVETPTTISEETNAVLISKWKNYVKNSTGQKGKILSWEEWQNSKEAKQIKEVRNELLNYYNTNLTADQRNEKSFDAWLFENKRSPEVYSIINSKGGTYTDYVITNADAVSEENLQDAKRAGDELISSEQGVNIMKKLVSGQSQDDDSFYYELVGNDLKTNLYEQYKSVDPNGKILRDNYLTEAEAIAAQKFIVGLLPDNSTFTFQGQDLHFKQILLDNNDNQFIVITTPTSFAKGGKLYLRPLETANDRKTSFQVDDIGLYRPLDTTSLKATTKEQNILKLRQSEPIKMYAFRQDNESAQDAEVRLSDRLKELTPEQLNDLKLKVSRNANFESFKETPGGALPELGTTEFKNPKLRIGGEELTVAVMNGEEILGFLQGPTGAILLDNTLKNVVNPLNLTEDQVDEYFEIYNTTKTQTRTKAEQLQIIKNNYASSILLNNKLKELLGGETEVVVNVNNIKGLNLRVSPGKMMYATKDNAATFSELVKNTIDDKGNFWILDNRSDGKGGIITNITDDELYNKTAAIAEAASEQTGYNPAYTLSRYVAVTRLDNGTFTFVELKADQLTAEEQNDMVLKILNTQDETIQENINDADEVVSDTRNFAFNEQLKDEFYIFGKSGEFIDIEVTARGDIQVIYRSTKRKDKNGKPLKQTFTINENDVKGVKENANPFNAFVQAINNKIKFKEASTDVKLKLKLNKDNFRKSIPKEATIQDLSNTLTNFQKPLRSNIRLEAVIADSAQINNVINSSVLPEGLTKEVQDAIDDTDQVMLNAEMDSPELTPEYMRELFKNDYQNVEEATITLIARKLAKGENLSNAERTIYQNKKNPDIGESINLLKLTYQSGVIEEGASLDVDSTSATTPVEKSESKKTYEKLEELEQQREDYADKIFNDAFNNVVPDRSKATPEQIREANKAAQEAEDNDSTLKDYDRQIQDLKKKLAPKTVNQIRFGEEHIEKIDTFITWAKTNLPEFIQIQDIQDLSARLKGNGKTAGMFVLELNSLANNIEGSIYVGAQTPFKYHEAFHGVFRMLLSEAEIKKYLAIAKKEKRVQLRSEGKTLSQALNELKSSHSIYNNLTREQLEERLYEEYLADKFEEFKINAKNTKTNSEVKSLFNRIIEWIKAVIKNFTKNELTTLFENIDAGKYKTASVQNNRFTSEMVENGTTSAAPKVIPIDSYPYSYVDPFTGQEIVSLANTYMTANDQRKMIATIASLYRSYIERGDLLSLSKKEVLDKAISDYIKLLNPRRDFYLSEQNGLAYKSIKRKLKSYYNSLKDNRDIIAENVSQYLSTFDNTFNLEQEAFEDHENSDDTNVRRVDEYGKTANQIGGYTSLPQMLREFIATTVLEEQDLFGNKETLDGIPIVTTVDYNFAYNGILKALANKTTDLQMLQALATFSSTNVHTAAVVNNIFKEIGINDPSELLDLQTLPAVANPNFLQKVIKGFNQFKVDYMMNHKDAETGVVYIYAANKKDDGNMQLDQWSEHFEQVYPQLLSNAGNKKAVDFLNLFRSKLVNPKERSRQKLDEEAKNVSKNLYDLIGIQINAETIKYSMLSNKPIRKKWEDAIVELGIAAGADPISAEDITEIRNSISRGENLFLDNQTNIPENEIQEQNTAEELPESTGVRSRLRKLANTNAFFDESVGATVFRDSKGNFIYAHQMPTFHLVKVAEMNAKDWAQTKIKENTFFNKNYLLNNDKFLALVGEGKLKVTRFIGSKEGQLDENEFGTVVENRGLSINQKAGVSFGDSSSAEFAAVVINSYVEKYNRTNQEVPLNDYFNKETGKDDKYIEAPIDLKVMSDASTNDFVALPVEKFVEQDDAGDLKLTDKALNALVYNLLQSEYNRVKKELDPNTAETDTIELFNTSKIKKGVEVGHRGKRFVRSKGFITRRKSKIKALVDIQAPKMSDQTANDIVNNKQKIILRSGKAQAKINLPAGEQASVLLPYKVDNETKYANVVVKNRGLVSVSNIDALAYIDQLGDAVSKKPIAGKKKQNTAKIDNTTYYFQRLEDAKFFNGLNLYAYEFITADTAEEANIETGVEEVQTTEGTEQQVEFFESDNFIEETLINAAKEGLDFDQAVEKIGEDKLKDIIEERMLVDFFDFRRLLTNTKALDKISVEIKEGLGTMIRPQKGKRGKSFYQVTKKGREAMKLFNLKENDLDYNLLQIYMHQFINARSMNDVLLGDHARLFTSFTDESKRAKMQNAAGPNAASALTAPSLGITHTFNSNDSISLFTYHDPQSINKFAGTTTDETDAFMVGTVKAFRYMFFGIGRLSIEQANLLDKIQAGETISVDDMWGNVALGTEGYKKLNALINSKKFVYGDGQTYLKMSFFVLTPELTSYKDRFGQWQPLPQMEELHNLRMKMENFEKGKETVALAIPTSGSKMMKKNVISADEMYSNKPIEELQLEYGDRRIDTGLNPKFMRLQVVNPSNKIEIVDPRQMKQLVLSEQSDNVEVVINGKTTKLGEVREAYNKSVSAQTILRFKNRRNLVFDMGTALDEIGKSKDLGKTTPNLRSFLRYALAGLESSQAKTQMLEFFSFDEAGNPKYDLNNPITIDKFQQLFLAYFSKGILAGKQHGVSLALASSYGSKVMRVVKKLDENGQPLETEIIRMDTYKKNPSKYKPVDKFVNDKFVDLKVGDIILQELQHNVYDPKTKTYYSEFMMAPHHREVQKFIKPGDTIPQVVAEALGIRIPSQDKHSAISLRLVDFLPVYYGSTAMFPKELIEISGADFDIDKLYTALKEFYYKKGQFQEYGKGVTEKDRYVDYIRYVISQANKKGSPINEAIVNWSTTDSPFLDAEEVEMMQDDMARETANQITLNVNAFNKAYDVRVINYIIQLNDQITDEQIVKLYNKNEDLYGALQSLGLPVTLKEYKDYVAKNGEPYEAAINNDILDQRIALVANEGVVKPIDGREIGYGNEPANLEPLYEIRDLLQAEFPEIADFANPEDVDPDSLLGLVETWASIKTGEGAIGAVVRPNVVLSMLGVNNIKIRNKALGPTGIVRFNRRTFDTFATPYTLDGKPKDKATRTQYAISALITMATDNAKERLADVLGINKSSLSIVASWTSLGVPLETSILILKNPVIKLGYDLALNKSKPTDPGIASILKKRQKFLQLNYEINTQPVTDQVLRAAIKNNWVDPTQPLTQGFGKNITGQTPEEYSNKDASIEYAINQQIINGKRISDYVGYLGSLVDLLSGFGQSMESLDSKALDFKKLGLDLNDSDFKNLTDQNYISITEGLDDSLTDGVPVPFDARPIIKGNDFRATYYKIFKEFTEDLIPAVFITRTKPFQRIKDTVLANMVNNSMIVDPKRKLQIEKDILSYLTIKAYRQFLMSTPNGIQKLGSLQNGMIYDDIGGENTLTIEKVVNSIRNYFTSKGQENYFINKFVSLNLASSENNKAGLNRLKGNNWTKMSDTKAVDLQASFAEIYSIPALKEHAYNLMHYLLVKDGMQFDRNTFLSAVPAFMFDQVLRAISTGHKMFKSNVASDTNLVFGMSQEELNNDFTQGYLKANKNGYLIPTVKRITKDTSNAAHIDSDGNLQLNIFNGVSSFINKKGQKVVKGKKFKLQRKGASIFINTKSNEYKKLIANASYLSSIGIKFNRVEDQGRIYLEMILPLYLRNEYQDQFGSTYVNYFELNQVYREKRFSQTGDVLNMLEGEENIVKGFQATYTPVELVGSNQNTAVAFVNGEVPTYNALKKKYKSDAIDNLIAGLDLKDLEEQIAGLDLSNLQELYDQAVNTGENVQSTNKNITIDGKSLENTDLKKESDVTDVNIDQAPQEIQDQQLAATNMLLNMLNAKQNDKSSKSDTEIKKIRDWWADPATNRYEALNQTKRSNLEGLLEEFNNFDGTAERFIEIINNCK